MHRKILNHRVVTRYLVGITFSAAFGFMIIALLLHWSSLIFQTIPFSLFSLFVFCGITVCAIYSSLIGEVKFNRLAITIGVLVGSFTALNTVRVELLPYSVLGSLLVAAFCTSLATVFFPRPGLFRGESNVLSVVHILQTLFIIIIIIYSLLFTWAQPFMLAISVSGLLLWSKFLVGGCPMTLFESDLRRAKGEQVDVWKEGFIAHYMKKLLHIDLPHTVYEKILHLVAIFLFLFWIYGYVYRNALI